MKFLGSIAGLALNAQIRRAMGACIFLLLFAFIFLLSSSGIARGQCNYIPADVNDNQAATALADVVYFVQYLKGIGLPPPLVCDCSPSNPALFAAADVDASCAANGVDVTRMVSYYMLYQTQFISCPDCPSDLFKINNDYVVDGSGSPGVIASDPNAPDEIVLGNLDGSRINVVPGQIIDIPLWVMNDEYVAALSISFETDDQYLTPGGGTFLAPLSDWDHHQFRALEANYPVFGRTTQAMLGYCKLWSADHPYLNTSGGPHQQIATLMVTVSPDPANIGSFTVIEFGAGNRLGPTAFCDTLGMEEWNPECQPCTLNIISSNYGYIGGTVFYDEDGDCAQDPDDTGLPYWEVWANPGGHATITDQYGNYLFENLLAGTYTVGEVVQSNWIQTCPTSPGTYAVVLAGGQNISGIIFGNNGGASPILDLACYVGGGPARPGFYKEYGITCQNKGTMAADATIVFTLPAEVTFTSCSPGGVYDNINHNVTWNISSLPPGWTYWLTAVVLVPSTVPLGRILTSGAQIIPVTGTDINPADNTASESQEVRGSFDPNEKLVSPEGVIERTDMLTYQINFQNVGTDTAFNIVVKDTLDPNLNISTFISGASIHPYTYKITGREICWTFADINLPDSIVDEPGSHGFVKFNVYPIPTIPAYTIIENRASIFFDFNPPVITNTASNQIAGPPDCIFTPGDANGSGTYNGLDVIYAVSYLKGGSAPIDSCDCPPWPFPLYAAADANGSCTFNGLDVTYGVSYLKMIGPAPLRCPDCPPDE